MDDALRLLEKAKKQLEKAVLILILMDDALRQMNKFL